MSTDPAGSLTGWSPVGTATKEVPPALADEEFSLLAPKNDRPAAAAGGPAVFSRGGCLPLQVLSLWQLQAALLHEHAQAAISDML